MCAGLWSIIKQTNVKSEQLKIQRDWSLDNDKAKNCDAIFDISTGLLFLPNCVKNDESYRSEHS